MALVKAERNVHIEATRGMLSRRKNRFEQGRRPIRSRRVIVEAQRRHPGRIDEGSRRVAFTRFSAILLKRGSGCSDPGMGGIPRPAGGDHRCQGTKTSYESCARTWAANAFSQCRPRPEGKLCAAEGADQTSEFRQCAQRAALQLRRPTASSRRSPPRNNRRRGFLQSNTRPPPTVAVGFALVHSCA